MNETLLKTNLSLNSLVYITAEEIREILLGFSGITLVGLETITDARAKKTGNPFKKKTILKQSRFVAHIGGRYENWLNNQAKREGLNDIDFDVKPRVWGERLNGTSLVYYDKFDRYYLEVLVTRPYETIFTDIDGEILTREQVEPFLPKKKESSTQDPLKKKVYLRDFKLDSIKKFAFANKVYMIG